jgi:hypothetical protein
VEKMCFEMRKKKMSEKKWKKRGRDLFDGRLWIERRRRGMI